MSSTLTTDVTCGVFRRLPPGSLPPDTVHRFVVGEDARPRALDRAQAAAELRDPFATELLGAGVFPRSAGEVLSAFEQATGPDDPLRNARFFLVGEGSQLPFTPETALVNRNLRFLASVGDGPEGPEVILSAFHPDTTDVELMAWDRAAGGFNFYRTVGNNSAWVFAGNSRHALLEQTEFKGPFESHTSGNFLMKELRAPWLHWHSPDAPVTASVFAADNPLRNHPWFQHRDPLGAFACETEVARPSVQRWTRARFATLRERGRIDRPARIMQQILGTPTVNLITSHTESRVAVDADEVGLPQTFFVDSQALTELLGLPAPPKFTVRGDSYAASLNTFNFEMSDGEGFRRPGDAHFAFVVPERALEDEDVLRAAIDVGLLTRRLAACLLMVDFPNPVFSARRAHLLSHVPAAATIGDGDSSFAEEMAATIVDAADAAGEGSPEQEFAHLWASEDNWPTVLGRSLADYYDAVAGRLSSTDGFNAYCRLAESRRERVRAMPIFETPLLFPQTSIGRADRAMRPDGTVVEV